MSTELQTTSQHRAITHGRNLVVAGSRLYAAFYDGSDLVYHYSDDDGDNWSSETFIAAGAVAAPSAFYDSANARLNICYATNGDVGSAALKFRAITSNVASGTPGSLTTETTIDAGGTDVGIVYPYAWLTGGGTPRYWIVASKQTSTGLWETRAWFAAAGSGADTAGNWATTNFTNLGGFNGYDGLNHAGVGVGWTIGGNARCTIVFAHGDDAQNYRAVTFDPAAGTPTPGSVTSIAGTAATVLEVGANGPMLAVTAKADYLIFGRFDDADDTWDFFKTVDGTTWSQPTGWDALTMGRAQLALSGADFYLLHTESYGAIATTAQALKYRLITASSDAMGSANAFSDTNGNGVTLPIDTGTSILYGLYRGSTASPFTVRSDYVIISAPAATTSNMTLLGVG